jgi:hypothetical protein
MNAMSLRPRVIMACRRDVGVHVDMAVCAGHAALMCPVTNSDDLVALQLRQAATLVSDDLGMAVFAHGVMHRGVDENAARGPRWSPLSFAQFLKILQLVAETASFLRNLVGFNHIVMTFNADVMIDGFVALSLDRDVAVDAGNFVLLNMNVHVEGDSVRAVLVAPRH